MDATNKWGDHESQPPSDGGTSTKIRLCNYGKSCRNLKCLFLHQEEILDGVTPEVLDWICAIQTEAIRKTAEVKKMQYNEEWYKTEILHLKTQLYQDQQKSQSSWGYDKFSDRRL